MAVEESFFLTAPMGDSLPESSFEEANENEPAHEIEAAEKLLEAEKINNALRAHEILENVSLSLTSSKIAPFGVFAPEALGPEDEIQPEAVLKQPRIWAVGGGKGGVGKSLICANFSMSLALKGHSVLAIDLDLGGSNLHTCLGVEPPKLGIGDWFTGRNKSLPELFSDTQTPNLKLVSGSSDPLHVTAIAEKRRGELLNQIRYLILMML